MPQLRYADEQTGWAAFFAELDAWRDAGRVATFWWRDDDATDETPALTRLLDIAGDIPVSLASIPRDATTALANAIADQPNVSVLQHGYAHTNHAPPLEKKAEFGPHRPLDAMQRDLTTGFIRLRDLFGPRFQAIFVPPWNRMADSVAPLLPQVGLQSFSTYGLTQKSLAAPQVNTHADIINWRGGRTFLGESAVLDLMTNHLSARRRGDAAENAPTGLLTHHLVHDDACWRFTGDLVQAVTDHPAASWKAPTA
ncbi:MAG: polysaccharide deacetylase [Rhodospirillaceae bacterium]|jgi:hypothetical protein|nr:polysaccharide deacetylase [Rhodospirillaceae bacterium]MBT5664796.1 polysaccharide deacetylase [Rhodospirillaceae bacterium]MBT5810475.1 polysaccharide deacetylase [Rhodospirillaceae bacterium]